jgi:hypothetical protein
VAEFRQRFLIDDVVEYGPQHDQQAVLDFRLGANLPAQYESDVGPVQYEPMTAGASADRAAFRLLRSESAGRCSRARVIASPPRSVRASSIALSPGGNKQVLSGESFGAVRAYQPTALVSAYTASPVNTRRHAGRGYRGHTNVVRRWAWARAYECYTAAESTGLLDLPRTSTGTRPPAARSTTAQVEAVVGRLDEAVERDVQALDELAHRILGDLHLAKLGASGWPINRDRHARRCRARLVERQPGRHPAGGKEASTGSDDDGKDKQIQTID